jgi:iron-sulfur cluster repair protein YtfE (RIC family)
MLNQIKSQPNASESQDVAELLLACHQKIRHFSGVATKLAHGHGATEPEIAQAAASLHRYFSVALPLHEADENLSLHPRLRRAVPAGELAGPAADAMLDQHMAIDELVERLIPLWVLLKSAPGRLPELSAEMCALSKRLNEVFDAHLKLEEETIFPALTRYLNESELSEIVREMQARRKTG